jgi:hypothetical protein
MTPFTRFLMKHLPHKAVGVVLTLVYVVTLLAVLLLIGRVDQPMLYLDIARGQ